VITVIFENVHFTR